jgi:hypothetical protein
VKIWRRPDVTAEIPATSVPGSPLRPQTGHLSGDPGTGHTVAPAALPGPHAATVMFVPMGGIFAVPCAFSGGKFCGPKSPANGEYGAQLRRMEQFYIRFL